MNMGQLGKKSSGYCLWISCEFICIARYILGWWCFLANRASPCYPFEQMKDVLLFAVSFILVFVASLVFLLCAALGMAAATDPLFFKQFMSSPIAQVMELIEAVGFAALFISFFFVAFRIVHEGKVPYVKLLVVWLFSSAICCGLILLWQNVKPETAQESGQQAYLVPESTVLSDGGKFIFMLNTPDGTKPVWIYHGSMEGARFKPVEVLNDGALPGAIRLPGEGISFRYQGVSRSNEPDDVASLMRVMQFLDAVRMGLGHRMSLFLTLLYAAGISGFLCSLWVFIRLTRWPLFNALLLALLLYLAIPVLGYLFSAEFLAQLTFIPVDLRSMTPVFLLGAVSLLLWAMNALMAPIKTWRQEMT